MVEHLTDHPFFFLLYDKASTLFCNNTEVSVQTDTSAYNQSHVIVTWR
jgi:hypothetical protein